VQVKAEPSTHRSEAEERHGFSEPSAWVRRFSDLVPKGARVLDVACGAGRHSRFFLERGCRVTAVDRDMSKTAELRAFPGFEAVEADLENGKPWPFPGRRFEAVIVTNYLHRPLLPILVDSVAEGGVLIYETFARGHERFGRPNHPEHLLEPGELLEAVRGRLEVRAYELVEITEPIHALVQRICALRRASSAAD
jgi:SAM-dependent methyltransferase